MCEALGANLSVGKTLAHCRLPSRLGSMPKKKRKTAEGPQLQAPDPGEEEARDASNARLSDACIVISDSDGEQESKEEHGLHKKRTKQQLDRVKFAAKRKIAQMTEDEQFALALKMSEQEARQLNSQEEEEEELLRKAIAESLSSCQPTEASAAAALLLPSPTLSTPAPSRPAGQENPELLAASPPHSESPCSKRSSPSPSDRADENGQTDVAKRPLVVLTRLSQEIVESSLVSSIIVSPGKSQSFARSNENSSSPAGSSSSDTPSSLEEHPSITPSPTFPCRPLGSWPLAPRRLFSGRCSPPKPTGKEIDKHSCSNAEGESLPGCSEALRKRALKPSILGSSCSPASKPGHQLEHCKKACLSPEAVEGPGNATSLCTLGMADERRQAQGEVELVHYYWGVPFCPKGVDPNKYTQVILCQLEVYQKSLKQAQRQLLQKKQFGEPVVPDPCSMKQSKHGKGEETSRGSEGTDEQEEDADEKGEPEHVAWLLSSANGKSEKDPDRDMAEGRNPECGNDPASSSCQASQVLFAEDTLEEREPVQIRQSISALTPLDSKRSPDIAAENHAAEEITVCPETQPSPSQAIEPESREIHSSSKDVSLQANVNENAGATMPGQGPPADDPMPCPLCDRVFPISRIELHAMYCNGTGEDIPEDAPVMTRRQKEAKNKVTCKEISESVNTDKHEKCYLCKSLVPWKEYHRHVDNCLRSQTANGTQSGRRLRCSKDKGKGEGGLLSMLEQSERKETDAEMAATSFGKENLRDSSAEIDMEAECTQDVWNQFPQAVCSDSPLKSFTPISEAKDCLVDFKKQLAVRSGSLQPTKTRSRKKR